MTIGEISQQEDTTGQCLPPTNVPWRNQGLGKLFSGNYPIIIRDYVTPLCPSAVEVVE